MTKTGLTGMKYTPNGNKKKSHFQIDFSNVHKFNMIRLTLTELKINKIIGKIFFKTRMFLVTGILIINFLPNEHLLQSIQRCRTAC